MLLYGSLAIKLQKDKLDAIVWYSKKIQEYLCCSPLVHANIEAMLFVLVSCPF